MATAPAVAWPITPLALDGAWPHLATSTPTDRLLPAPWTSLSGALADRYRIERELGAGGRSADPSGSIDGGAERELNLFLEIS